MSARNNDLYEFSAFRLDAKNGLLWRDDQLVSLKPKPIALLHLLLQQPGTVLTKQQIMEALWPDAFVEEANLTQTVYTLRKALSEGDQPSALIETVPKIGYRWVGQLNASPRWSALPANESVGQVHNLPYAPEVTHAVGQVGNLPYASEVAPIVPSVRWWQRRVAWAGVAILLLIAAFSTIVFSNRERGPLVSSVAVLPFATLSGQTADPALSLGLADALITRLGMLGQVKVSPTAAINRYNETPADALAVGKQLGVEAVLTGYIHRDEKLAGRMRLTAQLVRVSDGETLWTGAFDDAERNLFALEDNLTSQVTTALRLPLNDTQAQQFKDYGTTNLAAWQLYQTGRYHWNKRQWTQTKKAIKAFEQALALDPNYAQAYAGLADSYALWNPEMTPRERLAKAKPAAERALALNDRLPEAHASLGFIKYKFEWDWRGAEGEFKKALALNPSYATAHHWYGESLSLNGRHAEAMAQLQAAEQLNPLSFAIKEDIGLAHYRARDFASAERKFREVIELDPNFHRTRHKLADLLQEQGRYAEAFQEELAFWQGNQVASDVVTALQQAFQKSGWSGCARQELELIASGKLNDDAHRLARLSLRAGEPEQALQWLAQSFDELGEAPLRLNEPEFDALRETAQYQQLLHRAGHLL